MACVRPLSVLYNMSHRGCTFGCDRGTKPCVNIPLENLYDTYSFIVG